MDAPSPAKTASLPLASFYLKDLKGGGVQVVWLRIAGALAARGYPVDLVVCRAEGPLLQRIPPGVNLVRLEAGSQLKARLFALRAAPGDLAVLLRPVLLAREPSSTLRYLPALGSYLRRRRPYALYAATPYPNIEAWLARRLAAVSMRLIVSEHNNLSADHPLGTGWQGRWLPPLLRRAYLDAEGIVAVSNGVAADLCARTGLARERVSTIYNPAVPDDLPERIAQPVDHPWFQAGEPPVILGVGRLGRAKDFPTLLRAFARVRRQRPVRLMIIGEASNPRRTGKRQQALWRLAEELDISADFVLPGYKANPYPYMAHAGVFVLSSRNEGFGNALAEALACGCPVVSTDCPSGPAEILDHGRYGPLVAIGDDRALAARIIAALDTPPDRDRLRARGAQFSVRRAADRYQALLTA